jgi:hypothetical protein
MCERFSMRKYALLLACAGVLAGNCAPTTFLESGRLALGAKACSLPAIPTARSLS